MLKKTKKMCEEFNIKEDINELDIAKLELQFVKEDGWLQIKETLLIYGGYVLIVYCVCEILKIVAGIIQR